MGEVLGRKPCPQCRENGLDKSGDNLVVYKEGVYCFACGYPEGISKKKHKEVNHDTAMSEDKIISTEDKVKLKEVTTSDVEFRGIRPETNKYFGVRYFTKNDEIISQFVPCTINGELSGYKKRKLPKQFGNPVGETGKSCDMIGQHRFKSSKYICLIVGGEVDMLSAYQMLRDYQIERDKGEFDPIAVVSPSIGESGAYRQVQNQYDFFNQFDKIVIGLDNDAAGQEATDKLVSVLPKGKIYTVNWRYKDPNAYLWDNEKNKPSDKSKKFLTDFYNYKKYVPANVIGSGQLMDRVLKHAQTPKVPLPPFMKALEKEMAGGIPLGYVVNFGSASGTGKTSVVNEMIYYWIFHSAHKIGVVSMELEAGQYGEVMLSRHIGKKIALIDSIEGKMDLLTSDEIQVKASELFLNEDGEDRWHLVDDRDGGTDSIKDTVEELIVSCSCKIIILDPLQDLLDGMDNEEQADFMRWQKSMIKSHGVSFININHVRKSAAGASKANSEGAWITEEDFSGSSTIFKSAGANVLMMRNKYHDDPIERNTTKVVMSKCRWSGNTGEAGEYYYDNYTHTLHDKDVWMEENQGREF